MAGKLTTRGVEARSRNKGRYLDGDGLFLRVLDPGKRVYWTYRYRLNGMDREIRCGRHPDMTLAEARDRHIDLRKLVKDGIDPVGDRRRAKAVAKAGSINSNAPTIRQASTVYLDRREKRGELGKNPKHRRNGAHADLLCPVGSAISRFDNDRTAAGVRSARPDLDKDARNRIETAWEDRGGLESARGPDDERPTRRLGQTG